LGGAVRTLGVRVRKRDWEEGVGAAVGGAGRSLQKLFCREPKFVL
jgi:hypothetical protein